MPLAGKRGLLDAALIDSLTSARRRDPLPDVRSESDVAKLLDGEMPGACPECDRAMPELLYGAGLRASELVGVNLLDFQDESEGTPKRLSAAVSNVRSNNGSLFASV